MKKIFATTAFMALLSAGCLFAQSEGPSSTSPDAKVNPPVAVEPVAPTPTTKIEFTETNYDFGDIKQGDVVKHTFKFTNAGENDLVLKNVKPTCGCTALNWPREPIAPGESGEIEAQFNSRGKRGKQNKYFTIEYNGEPKMERVAFTGNVIVPTPKVTTGNSEAKPTLQGTETPAQK